MSRARQSDGDRSRSLEPDARTRGNLPRQDAGDTTASIALASSLGNRRIQRILRAGSRPDGSTGIQRLDEGVFRAILAHRRPSTDPIAPADGIARAEDDDSGTPEELGTEERAVAVARSLDGITDPGDRRHQPAFAVSRHRDEVNPPDNVRPGLRMRVVGSGSRPLSSQGRPASTMSNGQGPLVHRDAPIVQRLDPATISAAAAVTAITYSVIQDIRDVQEDDVIWNFDRIRGVKHPNDNSKWGDLTGHPWRENYLDLMVYKPTGSFGGRTGMKVRLWWESNGFSINGVYFEKLHHVDSAAWGATFRWLVQNLQSTGTNEHGYPKAKIRWRMSADFTCTFASTKHGNWAGVIDAEGGHTESDYSERDS